jgi:hypothetical protein
MCGEEFGEFRLLKIHWYDDHAEEFRKIEKWLDRDVDEYRRIVHKAQEGMVGHWAGGNKK